MNAEWEDEYLSISMCPDLMGRALWICRVAVPGRVA